MPTPAQLRTEADLGELRLFTPQVSALFSRELSRLLAANEEPTGTALSGAARAAAEQSIRAFATSITFALKIPGRHYSGLTNQDLFDILAAQGRDFAANTRPLREHVATVLRQVFVDEGEPLTDASLKQYAADAILEWIVARFEGKQHDVSMRPLSRAWLDYKRRNGMSTRIGVANGDLMEAIKDSGEVQIGGVRELITRIRATRITRNDRENFAQGPTPQRPQTTPERAAQSTQSTSRQSTQSAPQSPPEAPRVQPSEPVAVSETRTDITFRSRDRDASGNLLPHQIKTFTEARLSLGQYEATIRVSDPHSYDIGDRIKYLVIGRRVGSVHADLGVYKGSYDSAVRVAREWIERAGR